MGEIICCESDCNHRNDGNFFICLHCVHYCCSLSENGKCLRLHCEQSGDHFLYFELSSQSIYCCKCGSHHSSPWTDKMICEFMNNAKLQKKKQQKLEIKRVDCAIWTDFDCLRDNGSLGVRGVLNLGNSCYIGALLQIFAHNERMRNYFLSASHSLECKKA